MNTWNNFAVVKVAKEEVPVEEPKVTSSPSTLASNLKTLLASTYVLYHTIHGFHWNLKGSSFYEYHKFFDEIVSDVYDSIDPIAENILKLGDTAPFVMSQLAGMSEVKEVGLFSKDPLELAKKFHEMNLDYIAKLKLVFDIANKENEQGVANFIAERIDSHQKWDWFLKASLGE